MVAAVNGDTLRVEIFGDVVTLNRVTGAKPDRRRVVQRQCRRCANDSEVLVFLLDGTYYVAAGGRRERWRSYRHRARHVHAGTRRPARFTSSRSPAPYVDTNGD